VHICLGHVLSWLETEMVCKSHGVRGGLFGEAIVLFGIFTLK